MELSAGLPSHARLALCDPPYPALWRAGKPRKGRCPKDRAAKRRAENVDNHPHGRALTVNSKTITASENASHNHP
jgi:hypothetical protein